MNIHEHQAKDILREFGAPVSNGVVIFSINEDLKYDVNKFTINKENRSFKLIQNNSHPNFYLIDLLNEKKNIDVSQIREMITYTNKSSFNDMQRFILIDNIEKPIPSFD